MWKPREAQMTNEQLDRLSKLTSIFELCAKMGGTPPFTPIQQLVSEDLKELVNELCPPNAKPRPTSEPITKPRAIPATEIGRRV